jgi:hypothetical protein
LVGEKQPGHGHGVNMWGDGLTECSRGRVRRGKEGDVVKGQARAKGQRRMIIG